MLRLQHQLAAARGGGGRPEGRRGIAGLPSATPAEATKAIGPTVKCCVLSRGGRLGGNMLSAKKSRKRRKGDENRGKRQISARSSTENENIRNISQKGAVFKIPLNHYFLVFSELFPADL